MKKTFNCPGCESSETTVFYSARVEGGSNRRRKCKSCESNFLTFEPDGRPEEIRDRKRAPAGKDITVKILTKIVNGQMTQAEAARKLKCSESTVCRALKKYKKI